MKKIYKLIVIIFLIIFISFLFFKNYRTLTNSIPESIKKLIPTNIADIHFAIENFINLNVNKNFIYNVKFLPDTQLANDNGDVELVIHEVLLNKKEFEVKRFYIDLYKDNIFLITSRANIFHTKIKKINSDLKSIKPDKINTNLDTYLESYKDIRVIDSFINDNNIYISTYEHKSQFCNFRILQAKINFSKLLFNEIFINPGCSEDNIQGGRIQKIKVDGNDGLLFSLAENKTDTPNFKAQDDLSFLGKIIFLNIENKKTTIFSKGHRNPQGLIVENNVILSTEHGPNGGDEINKIVKGKNYGWPIASYGKFYNNKFKNYLNNHYVNGFEEPLYAYVTAIGISEIAKVPLEFFKIKNFNNIFFISSLRGRSLHLIKLDNDYNKVIFSEKIFINRKIRDLKYLKEKNLFLLALEEPIRLGLFKLKK